MKPATKATYESRRTAQPFPNVSLRNLKFPSLLIAVLLTLGIGTDGSCQTQFSQVIPGQPLQETVQPNSVTIQVPMQSNLDIGNGNFQIVPANQPSNSSNSQDYVIVYQQVTRQVNVFNQATGQYETKTYTEIVPVKVPRSGGENSSPPTTVINVPVPHHNARTIAVHNQLGYEVTFNVGNKSQQIQPGKYWEFFGKRGQRYSYSLPSRQVGQGQWVGGGTATGIITGQLITLGDANQNQPKPEDQFGFVGGHFRVNFVNTNSSSVDLAVYDLADKQVENTTIAAGQTFTAFAKEGYRFVQGGPVVYRNGGAVSGTTQGRISASQTTIQLGN